MTVLQPVLGSAKFREKTLEFGSRVAKKGLGYSTPNFYCGSQQGNGFFEGGS